MGVVFGAVFWFALIVLVCAFVADLLDWWENRRR